MNCTVKCQDGLVIAPEVLSGRHEALVSATLTDPIKECDDGNDDSNDHCKSDCTGNVCGDGVRNFLQEGTGGTANAALASSELRA